MSNETIETATTETSNVQTTEGEIKMVNEFAGEAIAPEEMPQPVKSSKVRKAKVETGATEAIKTRKAKVIVNGAVVEKEVPADSKPATAVLLDPNTGKIKLASTTTAPKTKKTKALSTKRADTEARIPEGFGKWTKVAVDLGVTPPSVHKLIKAGKIVPDKINYKPFSVVNIDEVRAALEKSRSGKAGGRKSGIDTGLLVNLFQSNIGKPIAEADIAECGSRASKSLHFYNLSQAGKKGGAFGATAAKEAGVVWDSMTFDKDGYVATVTVKAAVVEAITE